MLKLNSKMSRVLMGSVAVAALSSSAFAGGFAIREQSATAQGTSFAGDGANGSLGAMFWNSAAATYGDGGLNSESSVSLLDIQTKLTATQGSSYYNQAGVGQSANIGGWAAVPASYYNYQLKGFDPNLYLGFAFNSPFGLSTKPDDKAWAGANIARTSSIRTYNANPVIAYKLAPGISIGVGAQIEYMEGVLKFATLPITTPSDSTYFSGTSWAYGATAGITLQPSADTTVGLGWRSALTHTLNGNFATNPTALVSAAKAAGVSAEAEIDLPDIVTLSAKQSINPSLRALGTFEWSHWNRFQQLQVVSTGTGVTVLTPNGTAPGQVIATIPAGWDNGYMIAGGLEYDYSRALTLRTGLSYEWSPITNPSQRLAAVPDSNRITASIGAAFEIMPNWKVDLAYSHLFVQSASLTDKSVGGKILNADVDSSVDILSASLKTRW